MKKWIFLILLFPLTCIAQTYQYIGVEDGLSNRRVYYIQKDRTGYMWFLTHEIQWKRFQTIQTNGR